jgi:leucyl aminopeptidase (aminopeptidase T)
MNNFKWQCTKSVNASWKKSVKKRIIQTSTKITFHTQMIFHKRLTDGWQNVAAETYSLSTHLQTSSSLHLPTRNKRYHTKLYGK